MRGIIVTQISGTRTFINVETIDTFIELKNGGTRLWQKGDKDEEYRDIRDSFNSIVGQIYHLNKTKPIKHVHSGNVMVSETKESD